MTVTQPVPAPATWAEFEELLAAGVLITTGGQRLERRPCASCGKTTTGETCPASIRCPICHSTTKACWRPSEHKAWEWHKARMQAAEAIDDERERAGDPTLPARWPQPATAEEAMPELVLFG